MPVNGQGQIIAPFADEAMRLLREKWANPTMLAEEIFPILQTGIPQQSGPITININGTEDFIQFKNALGPVGAINFQGEYRPANNAPVRVRPLLLWDDPAAIASGVPLGGTQLNATATDSISGLPVAGSYEYIPPSGTVLSDGDNQPLVVVFTPTNSTNYLRARKTVTIDVGGGGVKIVPDITWSNPADINVGTALSGTQLNAVATDPITFAPVPGVFTYIPPSGTVLAADELQQLQADFVPTDTVTYDNNSGFANINVRHLGARLRITVTETTTGESEHKDLDFLFSSPSASDSVSVSDLFGGTYDISYSLSYDIGTGIFTTDMNLSTSAGSIISANPVTVNQNVGFGVNSVQSLGDGESFLIDPPVGINYYALGGPDWVSWIDS